jgi:hypothetical protein
MEDRTRQRVTVYAVAHFAFVSPSIYLQIKSASLRFHKDNPARHFNHGKTSSFEIHPLVPA